MGTHTQAGCFHDIEFDITCCFHPCMTLSVIMTLSLISTQEYAQLWSEPECNGANAYDGWINDRMQCAGFKWILQVGKVKILFEDFVGKVFVL